MSEHVLEPRDVHPLVTRFEKIVQEKRLLSPDSRVLVSVSGGPDSVALLSLLVALRSSWRLDLHVLHVNHGLRGEESEVDAAFVKQYCEKLRVIFHQKHCPIPRNAMQSVGASVQEKARDARYDALKQVGEEVGADRIALGHTADDQAETVLMWMIRGAGGRGLAGMPSVREEHLVRPLLAIQHADLLEYLHKQRISFRVDSSNSNLRYVRNRIRQEVVPLLQEFNPSIINVLNRQAEIFREEDAFMDRLMTIELDQMVQKEQAGGVVFPRSEFLLLGVPLQRRMVRKIIHQVTGVQKGPGFDGVSAVLDQVIHGPTGSSLVLQGVRVTRDYEYIQWRLEKEWQQEHHVTHSKISLTPDGLSLDIPGHVVWPITGQGFSARLLSRDDEEWERLENDPSPTHRALFDASLVKGAIQIRGWSPGDAFCPLGMGGKHKKIQDFFSDIKLPRVQRHHVPLVVGQDGILWVAGHRMDQRYIVTPNTRTILCLELEPHVR